MKKIPPRPTSERDFWRWEPKLVHGHHHVRSLDDGVSFAADGESEGLRGGRRDGGNDLFTGGGFDRHFAGHGTFLDVDDLAFDAVTSGNFHFFLMRGGHVGPHELLMDGTLYGNAKVVNLYL